MVPMVKVCPRGEVHGITRIGRFQLICFLKIAKGPPFLFVLIKRQAKTILSFCAARVLIHIHTKMLYGLPNVTG